MAWLAALLTVLGVIVCLALFVLWQMFWYRKKPRVKLPVEYPNGIPVLLQNGLPYPVSFSSTRTPFCGSKATGFSALETYCAILNSRFVKCRYRFHSISSVPNSLRTRVCFLS